MLRIFMTKTASRLILSGAEHFKSILEHLSCIGAIDYSERASSIDKLPSRAFNDRLTVLSHLKDFDECSGNNNHCHLNADCTNAVGSYKCQCSTGYTGDGITCSGIKALFMRPHK